MTDSDESAGPNPQALEEAFKRHNESALEALEDYTSDPLSPETRKTGKYLLLTAFVALAMTLGGAIPERISALGIEFGSIDQSNLFLLLSLLIFYLELLFGLRASADFYRWRGRFGPGLAKSRVAGLASLAVGLKMMIRGLPKSAVSRELKEAEPFFEKDLKRKSWVLRKRALLEYWAPLTSGAVTLVLCLCWAVRLR